LIYHELGDHLQLHIYRVNRIDKIHKFDSTLPSKQSLGILSSNVCHSTHKLAGDGSNKCLFQVRIWWCNATWHQVKVSSRPALVQYFKIRTCNINFSFLNIEQSVNISTASRNNYWQYYELITRHAISKLEVLLLIKLLDYFSPQGCLVRCSRIKDMSTSFLYNQSSSSHIPAFPIQPKLINCVTLIESSCTAEAE